MLRSLWSNDRLLNRNLFVLLFVWLGIFAAIRPGMRDSIVFALLMILLAASAVALHFRSKTARWICIAAVGLLNGYFMVANFENGQFLKLIVRLIGAMIWVWWLWKTPITVAEEVLDRITNSDSESLREQLRRKYEAQLASIPKVSLTFQEVFQLTANEIAERLSNNLEHPFSAEPDWNGDPIDASFLHRESVEKRVCGRGTHFLVAFCPFLCQIHAMGPFVSISWLSDLEEEASDGPVISHPFHVSRQNATLFIGLGMIADDVKCIKVKNHKIENPSRVEDLESQIAAIAQHLEVTPPSPA